MAFSEANGHIGRDGNSFLVYSEIPWVDDIRPIDALAELGYKIVQRGGRVTCGRLHLNRVNLVLDFAHVGNQEVNLDVVAVLLLAVVRVKEQLVTIGHQHLRNDVLIQHALVEREFVVEDLLDYYYY